jgi:aspartyl-tRNA(Asn)/glutamyl-tRNA(Gln) amidotransferase subunit B
VEVKNLNSFRFTEQAIEYEIARQWDWFQETGIKLGDKGGYKSTRGYNPDRGETYVLREKEEAADYRYFPDPDLVPVLMSESQVAEIRQEIPEPPALRRTRFVSGYQLTPYDAAVIIDQGREFSDYFEEVVKTCGDGKQAANWITQDVLRETKQREQSIREFALRPAVLGALLDRINQKQITIKSARDVFGELLTESDEKAESPAISRIDEIIAAKGLAIVQDTAAIDTAIAAVLARNPKAIADFKAGKQNAIGALIGQVMKEVKGADPQTVREKIVTAMSQS